MKDWQAQEARLRAMGIRCRPGALRPPRELAELIRKPAVRKRGDDDSHAEILRRMDWLEERGHTADMETVIEGMKREMGISDGWWKAA